MKLGKREASRRRQETILRINIFDESCAKTFMKIFLYTKAELHHLLINHKSTAQQIR